MILKTFLGLKNTIQSIKNLKIKKFTIGYFDQSLNIYKDIKPDVKKFYEEKLNKLKKEFQLKSINGNYLKNFTIIMMFFIINL